MSSILRETTDYALTVAPSIVPDRGAALAYHVTNKSTDVIEAELPYLFAAYKALKDLQRGLDDYLQEELTESVEGAVIDGDTPEIIIPSDA